MNEPSPINLNPRTSGLAYFLWFLSAVLGVLSFLAARSLMIRTYARFFPWDASRFQWGQGSVSFISTVVLIPLAMFVIAVIIGGFEYQHRNLGKPKAWRMLARTLAVEAGILLLALYI